MKPSLSTLLLCALLSYDLIAEAQIKLNKVNLKPSLSLQLRLLSNDGTNGSAVAWSEKYQKYYTLVAGNENYPIEVFDNMGMNLQSVPAGRDLRGLWFNPVYGFIEGNTYEYHDIVSFELEEDGLLSNEDPYEEMYELPVDNSQAVLTLNFRKNQYVWFNSENSKLHFIDSETGEESDELKLDIPEESVNNFNGTVAFTDIEKGEYALYNFKENKIYLFSEDSGKKTTTIKLPGKIPDCSSFRFSFANGYFWFFDVNERKWLGFKVY